MQHDNLTTMAIIDSVVSTFGGVIAQMKADIRALEDSRDDLPPILESIEGDNYKVGTLSRHRGGTFQLRADGKWHCIANNVHDITGKATADGMLLRLEMSNGEILEKPIQFPKPSRKKPVSINADA